MDFPSIGKAASLEVYCFSRDRKLNNSGSGWLKVDPGEVWPKGGALDVI